MNYLGRVLRGYVCVCPCDGGGGDSLNEDDGVLPDDINLFVGYSGWINDDEIVGNDKYNYYGGVQIDYQVAVGIVLNMVGMSRDNYNDNDKASNQFGYIIIQSIQYECDGTNIFYRDSKGSEFADNGRNDSILSLTTEGMARDVYTTLC